MRLIQLKLNVYLKVFIIHSIVDFISDIVYCHSSMLFSLGKEALRINHLPQQTFLPTFQHPWSLWNSPLFESLPSQNRRQKTTFQPLLYSNPLGYRYETWTLSIGHTQVNHWFRRVTKIGGARKNFLERGVGRLSVCRGSSGQPGSYISCPGLCPGTDAFRIVQYWSWTLTL